jgi:aspartate aminotransferase
MTHLSQRAREMQPSATLAMDAKTKQMIAAGTDVVSFATGEPDFDTPKAIREIGKKAIDDGLTRYAPSAGTLELRAAIREKLRRDNGLDYADDEVTVASGGKQAIYNALQVLIDPGDEVIVPAPYWVSYPDQVRLAGGTPIIVPTRATNAFKLQPEELERAIMSRTRAIILNYPSNPTGSTYGRDELAALAKVLVERGVAIISDEIYEKLLYGGLSHASIAAAHPPARALTILINGVSKAYAMTGWRMGYAAGPRDVIAKMTAIVSQQTSCVPGFVQKACAAALAGPQDDVLRMRAEFEARRDLMLERVLAIPRLACHIPEGAFYLLPSVEAYLGRSFEGRRIADASALAELLLSEAHVATVSGDPFGAPGYLRLSYATSRERIEEGMRRMAALLAKLV